MEWIWLSLLGGFGQALGWALKKKTLENTGVNNTLGFVSYLVAGIVFCIGWLVVSTELFPPLTSRFVFASIAVIGLNILAVWAAYKALDKSSFSRLMPLVAVTSLAIVPIEYLLRGILPNLLQISGIVFVVIGSIAFVFSEKTIRESLGVIGYFGITLACYSLASPFMGVMVESSGSGIFSGAVAHIGIALGFLFLLWQADEVFAIRTLKITGEWNRVLGAMILAGLVVVFLDNGPINIALESGSASEVFALKRTMPFFALILGVMMFNERIAPRHIIGTCFMVLGSVLIIWFQ